MTNDTSRLELDPPTVRIPRHAKKVTPADRIITGWPLYWRRIRNVGLFVIFFIVYGMALSNPSSPVSDICSRVNFGAPADVNKDGYIDCHSKLERGE